MDLIVMNAITPNKPWMAVCYMKRGILTVLKTQKSQKSHLTVTACVE